jgi:hypothetical protein
MRTYSNAKIAAVGCAAINAAAIWYNIRTGSPLALCVAIGATLLPPDSIA